MNRDQPSFLTKNIFILFIIIFLPSAVQSHSGRTDKNGCHTNRRTGEYHCHGGGRVSDSSSRQPNAVVSPQMSTPSHPAKKKKKKVTSLRETTKTENHQYIQQEDPKLELETLRTKCLNNGNLNAYWEPNTSRCLDRTTGRSFY